LSPCLCTLAHTAAIQSCSFLFFHSSGHHSDLHSFPTRRSSDLEYKREGYEMFVGLMRDVHATFAERWLKLQIEIGPALGEGRVRSEEHTSELQSLAYLVCRLLLEKKKKKKIKITSTIEVI